ncbi:hypothetical protein ACOME3_008625 [Neoechinorhynchus agilis]
MTPPRVHCEAPMSQYCAPWKESDLFPSNCSKEDESTNSNEDMKYESPWDTQCDGSSCCAEMCSVAKKGNSGIDHLDDKSICYNNPWDNGTSELVKNSLIQCKADRNDSRSLNQFTSHAHEDLHGCRTRRDYPHWWKPSLSRKEAENMLRSSKQGSFVIRSSETCSGHMSLSICGPNKNVIHIQLSKDDYDNYILGQCSHPFKSIKSMLSYYAKNPLPIKGAEAPVQLDPSSFGTTIPTNGCSHLRICSHCRLPLYKAE